MKLIIPVEQMTAALCIAAKSDIRYYLNGIYYDAASKNLVATNGTMLYVGQPGTVMSENESCILPREFCEATIKAYKAAGAPLIEIEVTPGNIGSSCLQLETAHTIGTTVDGRFPDWRHVYPKTVSGTPAIFDPELLMAAVKANKALGAKASVDGWFDFYLNGDEGSVAVLCGGQAHVVVMPYKNRKGATFVPFPI